MSRYNKKSIQIYLNETIDDSFKPEQKYFIQHSFRYTYLIAKYWILLLFCTIINFLAFSQDIPSPEKFLGYPLGDRFTTHNRIVDYFRAIALSSPEMVRFEQYGETYEHRPLFLVYISSPENLRRLESIRQNNLNLAGMGKNSEAGKENTPVIVWLSYNVHGNEPSSSESAMKMLYELVNPSNKESKGWLRNTVVIIDPCLNPDGRDRYVNWYNEVAGKIPNPDPSAREHHEPWPQGRSNHYYFNLNRDWVWQTQKETQALVIKYNEWLPQVHADFHEMGYNGTYYFPPAAAPYHDVITPWQREFLITLGKNDTRYFDKQGWLYFTKEIYDLFYPAFGDTYPLFNGAIGITYEQGGSGAGLAIRNDDGDTLTLEYRILRHYTTGMATIETASGNAERLVKEYHRYFKEAKASPIGEFKAYILQAGKSGDHLLRLKTLLKRNLISWEGVTPGEYTGLNYLTGKIQHFKTEKGDIVVNTNQPKSNLIRVLFERSSHISDSVTYDITAWSVPFIYGVQTFGLNHFVESTYSMKTDSNALKLSAAYAYAIKWDGINSARLLAQLLKKEVKVRFAMEPFRLGNNLFDRGTLLITRAGNNRLKLPLESILQTEALKADVTVVEVGSGFVDSGYDLGSYRVHGIKAPKACLITGTGNSSVSGEIWYFFEQELDYPITLINIEDLEHINWKDFDVCILPDGDYKFLNEPSSQEGIRNWIKQGGRLIALESAVEQLSRADWGIKFKDAIIKNDTNKNIKNEYAALKHYGNRERDQLEYGTPGSIYKVELDNSHPLAFGYPDYYYTLKQDSTVYQFLKEGSWNVGFIKKDDYVSGFTGIKIKEKLKDGLLFGVQPMGKGQVIYMADNPLFRDFWENGKLLFCNAVFLVGQ